MNKIVLIAIASSLLMSGCDINNDDLTQALNAIKEKQGGEVEPLPKPYKYNKVAYSYLEDRNPFVPSIVALAPVAVEPDFEDNGIRPDFKRSREPLELFDLHSLQFVGIFILQAKDWFLIRDPTGVVHKVRRGNHLGFNGGTILLADREGIKVQEIVPREDGGYIYRDNTLPYIGASKD